MKVVNYVTAVVIGISSAHADIGTSMTNFFNKMGVGSNVTGPALFNDQAAGYVTGGGVSLSGNVMDTRLAHIEMPSVRYGNCGDIDIYMGGFSFISGEQIVRTLKSVASSAAGYAFMLAMETMSPQLSNNLKQLQSWANTVNGIGINSCETASSLVSSVWPKSQMASQAICRSQASTNGVLSDYISSRHGCSGSTQYTANMNAAEAAQPNLLKDEFNLAWKVIHDDPLLAGDSALKHLFMSMTGTVIARKQPNGRLKIEALPSKVFDEQFMQKLMEGGNVAVYTCRDAGATSKCLEVVESNSNVGAQQAMKSRIARLVSSMQRKILSDETFTQEEIALLNKTRLPLLRVLNVMSAYRQGAAPVSLSEYVDLIAIDMVCQYIRNVLDVVRVNVSRKMQIQFDGSVLERYEDSLNRVEARVREYEHQTQKRIDHMLMIERKLKLLEQDIFSRMRVNAPI